MRENIVRCLCFESIAGEKQKHCVLPTEALKLETQDKDLKEA